MSILQSVGAWVVARAEERSTWTGIGALVTSMAFLPGAATYGQEIIVGGTAIAGALAVIVPTGGGAK